MSIRLFIARVLASSALAVSACQPITPPPPPTATSAAPVAPAPPAQPTTAGQSTDVKQAWQASQHANTFVADADGNNNDCARCHAPMNWLPTSMNDIPATCQACKFNISPPKPVVQADWKNIGCKQCHKTEKDVVTKEVAWLNAAIAQFDTNADPYAPITSNTALCEKCHRDAFKIDLGKGAHANKVCTDCHDAHSTQASCTDARCHANALKPDKPIAGHDAAHANVNCVACHDAASWQVEPTGEKRIWLTLRPTDRTGTPNPTAFASHNLQKQVDCARCHFAGNPWNLKTQ